MNESSFGRYNLLERIGQGGMGHVYRAFDTSTDRTVALKVLPPHLSEDAAFQQRFRREAHAAAGLSDPHVVPIHGYGEIDGRLYLDMRLIHGRHLGEIIADRQRLEPELAVHYVEQVAEALNAAHDAGLVHRDVKPSNVLVTARDFVYLIDFGIAQAVDQTQVTSTGQAIGTFAYMAPERLTAGGVTEARSDIYALTCVLYECLTGEPPFRAESVEQHIAAHLMTPPPRISELDVQVPDSFDAVIAKGLAKDPADRYPTALDLAGAARRALQPSKAVKPKRSGAKDAPAETKDASLTEVSPSASTVLAPTMLANAVVKEPVSSVGKEAAREAVARDPGPLGGAVFWAVTSIAFLASAAVLVLVFIGLVTA